MDRDTHLKLIGLKITKKGVIEYSLFFEKNNLYLTKKNIYNDPDLDEIESTSLGYIFNSLEIESCPEDVDYRIDPNYEDLDLETRMIMQQHFLEMRLI